MAFGKWRGPEALAWAWGLGFPAGFAAWLFMWFVFGGGDGAPEPSAVMIAVVTWIAWFGGMYLASRQHFRAIGWTICCVVGGLMLAVRIAVPQGTGLVALNLTGAVLSIPFLLVALHESRIRRSDAQLIEPCGSVLNAC